jgi:hypothetical protein
VLMQTSERRASLETSFRACLYSHDVSTSRHENIR